MVIYYRDAETTKRGYFPAHHHHDEGAVQKGGYLEDFFNHILREICLIISALDCNRENSKSQGARLKIIKTHFSGRDCNMQQCMDMAGPHAIAWMGRDDNNVYQFLPGRAIVARKSLKTRSTRNVPVFQILTNHSWL
jgi:hypothetical protein